MFWQRAKLVHRLREPRLARARLWPKLLSLGLLILCGVGGAVLAGLGSVRGVALVVGMLVTLGLLALPMEVLLRLMFLLTFVLVGAVGYFGRVDVVYWVPYLMGGLLYFRFAISLLRGQRMPGGSPVPASIGLLMIFMVLGLSSGLINGAKFGEWVLAVKEYVLLWSVLLIIIYALPREGALERLWRMVFVAVLIQVPVAIYQYAVVGGRIVDKGGQGWDAVSGTFGGSEAGGASAALAFVGVAAALVALALHRAGQLKLRYLGVISGAVLILLALAEVKAAVLIFLPLGLLLLYRQSLWRRPAVFLGGLVACTLVMVALFAAYQKLHYDRVAKSGAAKRTIVQNIELAFELETQASTLGMHTYDLGRTALLNFWLTEHLSASVSQVLIGHGPSTTKIGKFAAGSVAMRYPMFGLQKTAVSILLWEFGLIGLVVVVLLYLAPAWTSSRLAQDDRIPATHRAYLDAGTVVLLLLGVSLFYSRYPIESTPVSLLAMLCMGQAGYWQLRMWHARRCVQTGLGRQRRNPAGYAITH